GAGRGRRRRQRGARRRLVARGRTPDPARAEVAVEVAPSELREARATVAVAAGDRTSLRVVVLEDRQGQRPVVALARRVVAQGPLHPPPTVAFAARARGRLERPLLTV